MRQIQKESVKNMSEYKKPPCNFENAQEIGKGGNGKVVLVKDSYSPERVVKYFCVDSNLSKELKDRRYKRFCREIKTQEYLGNFIKGVLPVYDYYCPEKFMENCPAWFIMPKANKFNVTIQKSIVQKLEDMLELGRIIKDIHGQHMAHRDIKPENILIMNHQICLSDYGMVWIDGEESLTHMEERLGPIKIMPPELDIQEDVRNCDYTKSDVYLFAKVLWMYLKRDRYGFKGPYDRSSNQIYLLKDDFKAATLEPLHKLLQEATKDNWEDRPDIFTCMEYIHHQIMILKEQLSTDLLETYQLNEKISHYEASVFPSYKVYDEDEKIMLFLQEIIPNVKIDFDDGIRIQSIQPIKIKRLASNLYILSHLKIGDKIARIVLHISQIKKYVDKVTIISEKLTDNEKLLVDVDDVEVINDRRIGTILLKRI